MVERSVLVGLVISAGVVLTYKVALNHGAPIEHARTIAMTTMVLFQFFQAWNSRSETQSVFCISPLSNPFLFYSMVAAFLAQIAVVYVPAMQWVFRTVPLSLADWAWITLVAVSVVIVVEIDKWMRRR
jgi:magnesium-transporting ATPase (P-type)